MIVSRRKKFIFCRLPKTASTSVSEALSGYRDPVESLLVARAVHKVSGRRVWGNLTPFRDYSHLSMEGARRNLSRSFWEAAHKFTISRHPENWIVSYYHHVLRPNLPERYVRVFAEVRNHSSMDYFLDWLADRVSRPQCALILGAGGEILVDRVVRYERLGEEIQQLAAHLGISINVEHRNKGNYKADQLSAKQVDRVAELFAVDYTLFGYHPGGGMVEPDLRPSRKTRAVTDAMGLDELARLDVWGPFARREHQHGTA